MANVAQLQAAFDGIVAAATKTTDVEKSASDMLNTLGQLLRDNATDSAAILAIADGLTNKSGELNSSADDLAAAVVANTPAA